MKPSSAFFIFCLVSVFLLFQGWLVLSRVWFPVTVTSEHARLVGPESVMKTPFAGTVSAVHVAEGDTVPSGSVIAVIRPFKSDPTLGDLIIVKAIRPGVVSDLNVGEGEFVQASQTIAVVQELDELDMYVEASFLISTEALRQIKSQGEAYVTADFLNEGQPVRSRISVVSPVYNTAEQTVNARVEFLQPIRMATPLFSGLPVTVSFQMKNPSSMRAMLERAVDMINPRSNAISPVP